MNQRTIPIFRRIKMHLPRRAWIVLWAALLLLGDQRAMASLPPAAQASAAQASAATLPLREISYYPRDHAWLAFWPEWEQTKIAMERDLDAIRGLNANTVRVFVHPAAFNYPDPPTPAQRARFEQALALIAERGLRAHVNLFDCWWGWREIEASRAWMEAFVAPYAGDARIAVWELQNEVNLADPAVRDWVAALLPRLQARTGSTPCTVSLSIVSESSVERLADLEALAAPDLYSLHWYPSSFVSWTAPLAPTLERAKELVGADKLLLGEFGYDTTRVSEETQAALYRDVLYAARQAGIVHLGQWTLHDFPAGTAQCDPRTPAPEPERTFGVIREEGTEKPAAHVLREAYLGPPPASPSPSIVRHGSFELRQPYPCGLANWYPWDKAWTGACWHTPDCTVAHTGECSARLSEMPTTMPVGLYNVPALRVEGGGRYSLEGYVRTEGLEGEAWIAFSCFDEQGNWLGNVPSTHISDPHSAGWMRLTINRAQLPPDAAACQVFAQARSSSPASVVWFDDLTTLVERVRLPLVMR